MIVRYTFGLPVVPLVNMTAAVSSPFKVHSADKRKWLDKSILEISPSTDQCFGVSHFLSRTSLSPGIAEIGRESKSLASLLLDTTITVGFSKSRR